MSENNPWMCTCGKTNRGPACSNCGKTDESASGALNKAGQDASNTMRANTFGFAWVTASSSPTLIKGCWLYLLLAFGVPIVGTIIAIIQSRG